MELGAVYILTLYLQSHTRFTTKFNPRDNQVLKRWTGILSPVVIPPMLEGSKNPVARTAYNIMGFICVTIYFYFWIMSRIMKSFVILLNPFVVCISIKKSKLSYLELSLPHV